MHIDHSKLVELLVETSGIDKEKVESQLAELVEEINEAIDEGEAYEVDGFGVFSAIGNNVVFIPADELATEINYKYVGMEAIEMDDAAGMVDEPDAQDTDDPFAGLLDDEAEESTPEPASTTKSEAESDDELEEQEEVSEGDSPFGYEEEEQDETDEELEEKPGPDKWGIDTYKDDSDESMFSGLLGDPPKEKSEQEEEHFKAVFDQEDDGDEDLNRISEIERELSGEVDEDTESKTDEDNEDHADPFASLAGLSGKEKGEDQKDNLEYSDDENEEHDDLEEALSSSIDEETGEDDVDPVPVIKNITSDKSKKEKETKKEEKAKHKERKPFKRPQKTKKTGSQSAILLIIVIIVVLGSGLYGLGYFGVINIPGITPAEIPATTQTTPPAPNPEVTEPMQGTTESTPETTTEEEPQDEASVQETEQSATGMEQEPETQVSGTQQGQQATAGQASYGLTGSLSEAANDGYTIAVYSLTNEDNARAKVTELSDQGYRVILASIPHQQYGTLWRVSLGQFETMRDAALAAEDLGDPFTDNYFVTQIQ
ncbi:MAG: SPOR domain-containing protein [Gracilimonas sp.]|nr:SPOR domain-containing protein [Gracilimonas sp.]